MEMLIPLRVILGKTITGFALTLQPAALSAVRLRVSGIPFRSSLKPVEKLRYNFTKKSNFGIYRNLF